MVNKINSISGVNQASKSQEVNKKKPDASQVGKVLTAAVNRAAARADRRSAPGGGRLSSKVKAKGKASDSDHEEEEVFHGAIDPISGGHDADGDRQPHPEVPIHLNIGPVEKKSAKVEKTPEVETKKPDSYKIHESSTASIIWESAVKMAKSKENSIYSKIFRVPVLALGIVLKKSYDGLMAGPRKLIRKKKSTEIKLSNNYKIAFFLSRVICFFPSIAASILWFAGSSAVKLLKKKDEEIEMQPMKKSARLKPKKV